MALANYFHTQMPPNMDAHMRKEYQTSYDLVTDEYVRRIFDELQHKPVQCTKSRERGDGVVAPPRHRRVRTARDLRGGKRNLSQGLPADTFL